MKPELGPSGWCGDLSRGASMGRPSREPIAFEGKLYLQRIRLDRGGYDKGGAYWGIGTPLYWAGDENSDVDTFLRARDREDAKAILRQRWPAARFYR